MTGWLRLLVALSVISCLGQVRPALAAGVPLEPEPFSEYVAKLFQKALPDSEITVTAQLQLSVATADGDVSTSFLATLHDFCVRSTTKCHKAVTDYVAQLASTYADGADSDDGPKAITILVRPSRYVDDIRRASVGHGGPVVEALAGDLWIVGTQDLPSAIEMLNGDDAKKFGLTPKKTLALGKRNMRKLVTGYLRRYAKEAKPGDLVELDGGPYQSVLLAFPKSWRAVVKARGGSLLCALPSNTAVVCGDGTSAKAIRIVHEAALKIMSKAERPLSAQVLAWDDGAWVVAGEK